MTIISPRPLHGPERAIILFCDFHSAQSKQSQPQIVKPNGISNENYIYDQLDILFKYLPIKSWALVPKNSPRRVTRVPGGPSLGEIPVTTGGGTISCTLCYNITG